MAVFNPGTVLHAAASFTLGGAPGKYDPTPPAAVWSSTNPNDVFSNQVDDPEAGTSSVDIDGSANTTTNPVTTSVYSCTVDADRGKGQQVFAVSSETVEWTDTVDIEVDGGTITLANPETATAALAAKHAKATAAAAAPKADKAQGKLHGKH